MLTAAHATAPAHPLAEETVIRSELLAAPHIRHAFFTRLGGESSGIYAGLNAGVGSNDEAAIVKENRARAAATLGTRLERLVTPWQVHSDRAIAVDAPFAGERPKVDAVVTAKPGLAVAIVTADCGPVLLVDPEARVIGAAHAGWKGATGGVLDSTVETMETLGAKRSRIRAALGPTITRDRYEVGIDMMTDVVARDSAAEAFFLPGTSDEKRQFDLPAYILDRLGRLGVVAEFVGCCTYSDENRFFSYRRATHRREPDYGRQISAIIIEEHS